MLPYVPGLIMQAYHSEATSREDRIGPLFLWLSASHSHQESDAGTKLHTMHLRERKTITFTMVQEQFFKLFNGRHQEEQYLNSS